MTDTVSEPARNRVKVVDHELSEPPRPLGDLGDFRALKALVRLCGEPVGWVNLPLAGIELTAADLRRIALRRCARQIVRHHLRDRLGSPIPPSGLGAEELLDSPHPSPTGSQPLITVAVCTRDRAEDLEPCLDALTSMDYPRLDILIVDNAPTDAATERLVRESFPDIRYVCEPLPGLDLARNRAIAEARGEIIAFTDDDVIVDKGWVSALAAAFEDEYVMAVTGLIVPYELETEAQVLFEEHRGFGRGFERKFWRMDLEAGERAFWYVGAGQCGAGANMAFRMEVFDETGGFDPALDVGTVTNGGGDTDMLFRVLREGYLLAYEPSVLVRHRHRRSYAELRRQLANNGIGFSSSLVRAALAYPDTRLDVAALWLWWFWRGNVRRFLGTFVRHPRLPRDLIWAELWGCIAGLPRYLEARSASRENESPAAPKERVARSRPRHGERTVDVGESVRGLSGIEDCARVRVHVKSGGRYIGRVEIRNSHQPLGAARLREAIARKLGLRLLGRNSESKPYDLSEEDRDALRRRYLLGHGLKEPSRLSEDTPVSVIVPTRDSPERLHECLRCVSAQSTNRPVEILVADANPSSGLTPRVIARFPEAALASEPNGGTSHALNRGVVASAGAIVATVDDAALPPPGWLERLLAPFAQPDVMAVTGENLPREPETLPSDPNADGGLSGGFAPGEADGEWFESFRRRAVPSLVPRTGANAAFRGSIFERVEIGSLDDGSFDEGLRSGVDSYLLYKVLEAGYTVVHEPSACAWRLGRRDARTLRDRAYEQGRRHVAHHLATLLWDRDPRAVKHLAFWLPVTHLERLLSSLGRRLSGESLPFGLHAAEVSGNLAGTWSLRRRRPSGMREEAGASGRERGAVKEFV